MTAFGRATAVKVPRSALPDAHVGERWISIRQHALHERHVTEDADFFFAAIGENFMFNRAAQQIIRQFVDGNLRAGGQRLVNFGASKITHPDESNFPRLL